MKNVYSLNSLQNYIPFNDGLSQEITVKFIKVCGSNVTQCEKVEAVYNVWKVHNFEFTFIHYSMKLNG